MCRKKKWSLLFRTFKPGNDLKDTFKRKLLNSQCCWVAKHRVMLQVTSTHLTNRPSSAFQKPDKTEGDHRVAQVGREPQAWLALSSDPGCSGLCPVEFWNLPRTESAQLPWASCISAYVSEGFSWYKVGASLLSIYGLFCSCHAPLKSLLALPGDPRMHIGRQMLGPLRGHLFPGLNHPRSPIPFSQGKCSWASWGRMLNLPQFINICFVLRRPKTVQSI